MNLRLIFITTFIAVMASACITQYAHDSKGPQDFDRDYVDCSAKAGSSCGHGSYSDSCKRSMLDRCLRGEGWYPAGR